MFLLVNHIPDGLDGFLQGRYCLCGIVIRKSLPGLFQVRPDIVMNGPHHLGRTSKMVGFQHGKKLIFLARIMDIDF